MPSSPSARTNTPRIELHEAYPEYLWYPQVLGNVSHSSEYVAAKYANFKGTKEKEDAFLRTTLLKEGLGVVDISDAEVKKLKANKAGSQPIFSDIISRRAQIGWSTHGHSGVDVCFLPFPFLTRRA